MEHVYWSGFASGMVCMLAVWMGWYLRGRLKIEWEKYLKQRAYFKHIKEKCQ